MKINSATAEVKVFAEEVKNNKTTGYLIEIPHARSVSTKTTDSLEKGGSFTLLNPQRVLSTSYVGDTFIYGEKENTYNYLQNIYNQTESEFANRTGKSIGDIIVGENFLDRNTKIGVRGTDAMEIYGCEYEWSLEFQQRIWIVYKTSGIKDKDKYTIWAGIINDFSESYDPNGNSEVAINMSGISSPLANAMVHEQSIVEVPYETEDIKVAQKTLNNILNNFNGSETIFQNLSPAGVLIYTLWVCNKLYTYDGRRDFYYRDTNSDRVGERTDKNFWKEPLWNFYGFPRREDFTADNYNNEIADMLINGPESITRNSRFIGDISFYADRLFNTNDRPRIIDYLPTVYIDPAIALLFKNSTSFQKKVRTSMELFSTNSTSAFDVLNKTAADLMINIFEDDYGNVIMEIPSYWEAPKYNDEWAILNNTYNTEQIFGKNVSEVISRYDNSADYILNNYDVQSFSKTISSENIVTNVEVPGMMHFIEIEEKVLQYEYTGISGEDNDAIKKQSEYLQRKYGMRLLTTDPVLTENIDRSDLHRTGITKKKMLNAFADAVFQLRNYTINSITLKTNFIHWLYPNRNIFFFENADIYTVTTKQLSYMADGEVTMTLNCSMGHKATETIGYPYLDTLLKYTDFETQQTPQVNNKTSKPKKEIKNEEGYDLTRNEYGELFVRYGSQYGVDPRLLESMCWKESNFNPKALSPKGARGLLQVTQGVWDTTTLNEYPFSEAYNPIFNVRFASKWIGIYLYGRYFGKSTRLIVAAYNGGQGLIAKNLLQYVTLSNSDKFVSYRYTDSEIASMTSGSKIDANALTIRMLSEKLEPYEQTLIIENTNVSETIDYVDKIAHYYQNISGGRIIDEAFI